MQGFMYMYFSRKSRKILQNLSSATMMIDALTHYVGSHFCCLLITFANSLDPNRVRQNVKSDLVAYCLTLVVFTKIFKKLADSKKACKIVHPACRGEPQHEITNNVVCATSKASDQPAHTCSLIRAFASDLNILSVKLLT